MTDIETLITRYTRYTKLIEKLDTLATELNETAEEIKRITPEIPEDIRSYARKSIQEEEMKIDAKRKDMNCKHCKRLHDLWKKASEKRWGAKQ